MTGARSWRLDAVVAELLTAYHDPANRTAPGGTPAPVERLLASVDDGTSRHLKGGVSVLPPGYTGRPHVHDAEELVYVIAGSATLDIGGAPHRVGPGDILFSPAAIPHHTRVDPGSEPLVVLWTYAPGAAPITRLDPA